MSRKLACLVALVVLGSAGIAYASPPQLKGDYAFTGSATCLNTSSGFDSNLKPIAGGNTFTNTFSVIGNRHFNGDGTGWVKGTEVNLNLPTNAGAHSAKFEFDFKYEFNSDGTFSSNLVQGTFVGTYLTGPRTGQNFYVDTIPFLGLVSNNSQTLVLATPTTAVETVTFSDTNTPSHERICYRSRVATWIGN